MQTLQFEFGVASRAKSGQMISGDLHAVQNIPTGMLIAVVDGLGYGAEAATASRAAVDAIARNTSEPVATLFERCHKEIGGTRGVVMGMASINCNDETVTWSSVGNIEGILLRKDIEGASRHEAIIQRGGVVGVRLPSLFCSEHSFVAGDTIIMATDGIIPGFHEDHRTYDDPQQLADHICRTYAKVDDDALVLVVRYADRDASRGGALESETPMNEVAVTQ